MQAFNPNTAKGQPAISTKPAMLKIVKKDRRLISGWGAFWSWADCKGLSAGQPGSSFEPTLSTGPQLAPGWHQCWCTPGTVLVQSPGASWLEVEPALGRTAITCGH